MCFCSDLRKSICSESNDILATAFRFGRKYFDYEGIKDSIDLKKMLIVKLFSQVIFLVFAIRRYWYLHFYISFSCQPFPKVYR